MITDLTLHALFRLQQNANQSVTITTLRSSIRQLSSEHVQAAVDRGWVSSSMKAYEGKSKKATHYQITDAGTAHIRELVKFSDKP